MDLVYIPEVFTYGYSRNPQYRDYEQPWNKDYFKCNSGKRRSVESQQNTQQKSKEKCELCKDMKKRNLAVYIRSKSRRDSCHEGIHEEEEENDIIHSEKKVADTNQNKCTKSPGDAEK